MLTAFSRAPSQRLAYWQLADIVGIKLDERGKASLEVRVVRLRKKLQRVGVSGVAIEAIRGDGYQLLEHLQVV